MRRLAILPLLALAACESQEPPSACGSIPQVTVNVGETATVAACFTDPNGDRLVYSVESSNRGVATAYMSDTTVNVAGVAPGSASVTVTASDPGGLEAGQSFSVTVPNRAPVPKGTTPPIAVPDGERVTVDVSRYFTEPDGEALTYTAMSSNPAVATVSVAGSILTVTAVATGTAAVTVTARDPGGLTASQDFTVTVLARLTDNNAADVNPAWSPDGTQIAFASDRDGNFEIYVMDADGSNQTRLTNNDAWDVIPAWSPDGTQIAFTSNRDGNDNYDIYVMDADGGNPTRLTNSEYWDWRPAWSPDGTQIAFASARDSPDPEMEINAEVYVMDADGGNQTRLTNSDRSDADPAWSPDGTQIAFTTERDTDTIPIAEVYVMDADGGNQTRLTNNDATDGVPAWSPDGTRIAFTSNRDGKDNLEIYVMDADGGNQTRLTNNDAWDAIPAWSPDGTQIAFESERDGNFEIYVIPISPEAAPG